MHTGINIFEIKPYVSKSDPDKENPTTFQIGALDSFVKAHIKDQTTTFKVSDDGPDAQAEAVLLVSKGSILVVKFGLRGLDNFIDPQTNQPVKFEFKEVSLGGKKYPAVSDDILRLFSQELIDELAGVILSANKVTKEQAKN